MKFVTLIVCLLLCTNSVAASKRFAFAKNWLSAWAPESFDLKMQSSGVKFNGCKQKEYQLNIIQPIEGSDFSLESTVSYAKGKLSWGVFSQKISLRELSFIPRYQVSHKLSLGFGVVTQSAIEFKNTLGSQFDLPKNTEWLLSARTKGFAQDHNWELSVSRKTWSASKATGTWLETGAINSKINLLYTGYF